MTLCTVCNITAAEHHQCDSQTRELMRFSLVNTFSLTLYVNKHAIFRTRASLLFASVVLCNICIEGTYFSRFFVFQPGLFSYREGIPVCWMTHRLRPAAVCQEENPQSVFAT